MGRLKVWIRHGVSSLAFIIGASAAPAMAQTQAQQDRIDRVSRFVVTAPMCDRLGMTVDPDLPGKVEAAFKAETSDWSVDPATVERLKIASINRQASVFKVDLEAASENAKTDAQLRQVRAILLGYGRTCVEATSDPVFSRVISLPPAFNLDTAATDFADSLLEAGGLASWQTPAIQARGDMMMVAGACRKLIGKVRSDALVAEYGKSDDPRTRDYYMKSFDTALNDPELDFDLTQCNRLVSRYRIAIAKVDTE